MMVFVDHIQKNVAQDAQMDISAIRKPVDVNEWNVKHIRTVVRMNVVKQ
jgi:hypothetical protein